MKRFYTAVSTSGTRGVLLDGRPVRTPARAFLELPTDALANAVAEEWRAQGEQIDPRSMPLTGLANVAIDRVAPDPAAFARTLAAYAESDLLCYRAENPESLIARQAREWDPLLAWAKARYDVHFVVTSGVIHRPQPPATLTRLAESTAARAPFALAPLSPLVTISGSLVIALALAEGAADLETAWNACVLDERWQEEQWGSDPLAEAARNERRRDFEAAVRFLKLLA